MIQEQPAETYKPRAVSWHSALNILVPLVLTLVGSFLVLEVGLRRFYQLIPLPVCASDPIIGNYYCQPYFVYDKPIRIGYRYKPGFRFEGWWDPANPLLANPENNAAPTGRSDPFWYVFQTDEMGFPNDEYEWRDQYDVVITGDSFTIRTAPQTWIELLGQQTGFSILTLGASSWGTLNEYEAVRMYGLDKNPKFVLVMYFEGNDLLNVAQYLERQPTGLSWKEYDMQDFPLYRRALSWHMLKYGIQKIIGDRSTQPPRYRYPVTASTEAGPIEMIFKDIHLLPLSASYETLARSDEFAAIKSRLLDLKQLSEAQGARMILVYIPAKAHVYWSRIWEPVDVNHILERTVTVTLSEGDHGKLQWEPQYLSYDTFNANHNAQERLFADFTQENNIEFINLTPIFWQTGIQQGELYNYADPHWNQAGNQLAADVIADYLLQNDGD